MRRPFNQGFPFASDADLENRFRYHAPGPIHADRHNIFRDRVRAMADELVALVPPGRELACALTKLEEVSFWGHAGIARCELEPREVVDSGPEQAGG